MSQKNNTSSSHNKSSKEKKLPLSKASTRNNNYFKANQKLSIKNLTPKYLYQISFKNLKKYTTNKRKYNKYIINAIIFDHRIHKVAIFKNNLIWDESSEFLKRFYKKRESKERIPKISEYYESYTLYAPVYFGLEGLVVIIMKKWTQNKKKYLEYLEDHEEEKQNNKKIKESFEPLINSSSLNNTSKSLNSKNTLELTKFESDSKKSLMNKSRINLQDNQKNNKINANNLENISLSALIDNLSSINPVIINETDEDNNINNVKKELKAEKNIYNNKVKDALKGINKTLKINKKINNNHIFKKLKCKNSENFPKKYVKINLNKKENKYTLKNTNPNILFRNNYNNNLPIPSVKNFQKRFLNTDNSIKSNIYNKYNSKENIRVNTITSYEKEKNKYENDIEHFRKKDKEHNDILKRHNFYFIRNNTKQNLIFTNKKQIINTITNYNLKNSIEKNKNRLIKNKINILKKKNYVQIKKEPFLNINNPNNTLNNLKPRTYNPISAHNTNFLYEMRNNSNNNEPNLISRIPKINLDLINKKKLKDENNNKLHLEDPFIHKLTQINKKKIISMTTANSLSKNKNTSLNGFNSTVNSNINVSKNRKKNICKKNLVLSQITSKKSLIYNKKRKIIGDNTIRNKSANTSHFRKISNSSLNNSNQINNSKNNINKKNNSKNINLNLNLNIHFNIDVENKNKRRRILFNNATIINKLKNKNTNNSKYYNINKSKDKELNYKYPLTSRESNSHIKNLMDANQIEYNFFKKMK